MERGVCFSFFIGLYSCGAVSTGPEDTTEITSVVLVDEVCALMELKSPSDDKDQSEDS
ncbi:hypothetical protein F2Q70_00017838 [Brassica cretica]|uniref:Uncharacterized protein n=1 Tax=Brassica cretica TaxID=69181 RepID=A0A3N6PP19_BRACR|nr:hypothetical protein F2Q70_00017838 [Brassica cretica]KAF2595584.1 hypothetical protein F2Q68_00010797 [Brassica cretica]